MQGGLGHSLPEKKKKEITSEATFELNAIRISHLYIVVVSAAKPFEVIELS